MFGGICFRRAEQRLAVETDVKRRGDSGPIFRGFDHARRVLCLQEEGVQLPRSDALWGGGVLLGCVDLGNDGLETSVTVARGGSCG